MKRVYMLNQLTGMVMSVPEELVELYSKAGCKPVEALNGAEDPEGTEPKPEGSKAKK